MIIGKHVLDLLLVFDDLCVFTSQFSFNELVQSLHRRGIQYHIKMQANACNNRINTVQFFLYQKHKSYIGIQCTMDYSLTITLQFSFHTRSASPSKSPYIDKTHRRMKTEVD